MSFNNCSNCGNTEIQFYHHGEGSFSIICNKCKKDISVGFQSSKFEEIWNKENPIKEELKMNKCLNCGNENLKVRQCFGPVSGKIGYNIECNCQNYSNSLIDENHVIKVWNQKNPIKEDLKMNNCSKCGSFVQLISRDYDKNYFTIKCQNKNCDNILNMQNTTKENIINHWNKENPIKEKCLCGHGSCNIRTEPSKGLFNVDCPKCGKNTEPLNEEIKLNNCLTCGSSKIEMDIYTGDYYAKPFYAICTECGIKSTACPDIKSAKENWNKENPIKEEKRTKLEDRPKTIFTDLDGCLIKHCGDVCEQHLLEGKDILLPDTLEKIKEWDLKGYRIIITTGRKESTRTATEKQLSELGILYDQLIMGITGGIRVIINDTKPNSDTPTCVAINVERNKGLEDIEV